MKKILIFLLLMASVSFADSTFLNVSTTSMPSSVQPGNAFTVELLIENWGTGSAQNVVVTPTIEGPFTIRPGSDGSKKFLELLGRRTLEAEFHFVADSDATTALYPIKFKYNYEASGGGNFYGEKEVKINVEGVPLLEILDLHLVPENIKPGNKGKVALTLKNIGTGQAKNIRVLWSSSLTTVKPLGGDVSYASLMEPGEELQLEQDIIIPSATTAGTYSLPVTISYEDETNDAQTALSRSATVLVSSDIELRPFLSSTDEPIAGKKGEVTETIANTGPSTAEYLYVSASSDTLELKPAEDYIGNLKSDDFDSISFEVSGEAGDHLIDLKLSYADQFNNAYEEDREVKVKILTAEESAAKNGEKNNTTAYIAGIAVLAVAYHFYRKKKRKKEHEKK